MFMPEKVRSGLLLLRSESGIAMPTVLMVTVISLGLGSVAAVSSISAQRGSDGVHGGGRSRPLPR